MTTEELAYKLVKTACPHDYGKVHCPACATEEIRLALRIDHDRLEALRRAAASLVNSGAHDQCGAEDMPVCSDAFRDLAKALRNLTHTT